jgi:hypothetical protein
MNTFNAQVNDIRDRDMAAKRDVGAAKAAGASGRDHAALKHSNKLQIARRIARELGGNGPICIDDITDRMVTLGYESDTDVEKGSRRFWKGKVFANSEWVPVDQVPSRRISNHGRPVTLWALKSWVRNGVNGEEYPKVSAYHLIKIKADFERDNPHIKFDKCNWCIGMGKLSKAVLDTIKHDDYTLYQAPVQLIPGAVGAILQPPAIQVPIVHVKDATCA